MKNFSTIFLGLAVAGSAFSQTRVNPTVNPDLQVSQRAISLESSSARATGDTILYIPFPNFIITQDADTVNFRFVTEDADNLPTNNAGFTPDFELVFSDDSTENLAGNPTADNFYQPWETYGVDSAFFLRGTSWFNPPGQANNWIMFGPIRYPAGGAQFQWRHRTNPAYRDGYKVWVVNNVLNPLALSYTDFDQSGVLIYSRSDSYPSTTYITDTTWQSVSAQIYGVSPATEFWIAFQHDANDMDVLYLDELLVTEALNVGTAENKTNSIGVISPNPASSFVTMPYSIQTGSNEVRFEIIDAQGRIVETLIEGARQAGAYARNLSVENLADGFYSVRMTTAQGTSVQRFAVIR